MDPWLFLIESQLLTLLCWQYYGVFMSCFSGRKPNCGWLFDHSHFLKSLQAAEVTTSLMMLSGMRMGITLNLQDVGFPRCPFHDIFFSGDSTIRVVRIGWFLKGMKIEQRSLELSFGCFQRV